RLSDSGTGLFFNQLPAANCSKSSHGEKAESIWLMSKAGVISFFGASCFGSSLEQEAAIIAIDVALKSGDLVFIVVSLVGLKILKKPIANTFCQKTLTTKALYTHF